MHSKLKPLETIKYVVILIVTMNCCRFRSYFYLSHAHVFPTYTDHRSKLHRSSHQMSRLCILHHFCSLTCPTALCKSSPESGGPDPSIFPRIRPLIRSYISLYNHLSAHPVYCSLKDWFVSVSYDWLSVILGLTLTSGLTLSQLYRTSKKRDPQKNEAKICFVSMLYN